MTQQTPRELARTLTPDPRPWVQFRALIANEIETDILEPGDEVSVVLEAEYFGIARKTAIKAFRALVAEGKLIAPPHIIGGTYLVAPTTGARRE